MKKIKNNTGSSVVRCGQTIASGDYYVIENTELSKWQNDSLVLSDIGMGNLVMNDYTDDLTDVATAINYLKDISITLKDSDNAQIVRIRAFANADNLKFRGTGISATVPNGTTHNIDYKLTENRYINGIEIFLKNQHWDDKIKLQVIDIDNIFGYGANTVLDEFATNWHVADDEQRQGAYIIPYPALVVTNLYVRVVYISAGSTDVLFKANVFLHKKP